MPNEKSIGALWRPRSENPKAPVLKGNIEIDGKRIQIVIWKNRFKDGNEKRPDYYINVDHPKAENNGEQPKFDDDIPF